MAKWDVGRKQALNWLEDSKSPSILSLTVVSESSTIEHMGRKQEYEISYDPATKEHLRTIDAKHHALLRKEIEEQLRFEPADETRNRKPLRQPAPLEATWELRCGPRNRFRVLYGIDEDRREVQIQAIGVKDGNRLLIGGEEVEL